MSDQPLNWQHLAEQIGEVRILPVTSFDDAEQAQATADALMRGGINCIEITFRTPAAAEAIRLVSKIDCSASDTPCS